MFGHTAILWAYDLPFQSRSQEVISNVMGTSPRENPDGLERQPGSE